MKYLEKNPMIMIVIGIMGISLSAIFVKYSQAPSVVTAAWRLLWTVLLMSPVVWGGREQRRGEARERVRGLQGVHVGVQGVQKLGGKQEVASYGRARVGHTLCVRLAQGGRRLCPWWAGSAYWPPGGLQVSPGEFALSPFYCFCFFNIL